MTTDLYTVISNKQVAPSIFSMTVKDHLNLPAQPGQFHMLKTLAAEPLLPRPLSINDVENETLTFLYEAKGDGTKNLAALTTGQQLRITGPLGQGFDIDDIVGDARLPKVLLVAGGIGIAPFKYLARSLKEKATVSLAAGFRSNPYAVDDFKEFVDDIKIATEDGSYGVEGRVTLVFNPVDFDVVIACGPTPMMRAVKEMCKQAKVKCILSMEARMACGIGACLGCTIRTTKGMLRVCADGPVFDANEVIFND